MPHPEESRGVAQAAVSLAELVSQAVALQPSDDVQSGDWVPADASGAGLAITVNDATFVKRGSLVIARCRINYPVTASGAAAKLTGLPYMANARESGRQGFLTYSNAAIGLFVIPNPSTPDIALYVNPGGAAATNLQLTGAALFLTVIYSTGP